MKGTKGGRPPYQPTSKDRGMIETLVGMGATQEEIAPLVGISLKTLTKYYEAELQQGVVKANMQVAQSLYQLATHKHHPNVAAMIFWLKTRAGWRETAQPIDMQHSWVVRAPAAVDSTADWFARYAPREALEHDADG